MGNIENEKARGRRRKLIASELLSIVKKLRNVIKMHKNFKLNKYLVGSLYDNYRENEVYYEILED